MNIVPGRVPIGLKGDKHDLDTACTLFSTGTNLQIQRVHIPPAEKTALFADELNAMTDEGEIYATGQRLLDYVNGMLFLHDTGRVPLETQGIVHRQTANGNWGVAIHWGVATARSRVSAISDNRRAGEASDQALLLQRVSAHEAATEALSHLRGSADWFDLYKAYEVMRADIRLRTKGGAVIDLNWPSRIDIGHFTASAQVYRHAKEKWPTGYSPATAMDIRKARKFVGRLCASWLKTI